MSNDLQTRFASSLPNLTAALADITLTALQRTFALNASMMEQMLSQGIGQSEQALERSASGEQTNPWQQALAGPAAYEQLWRYSAGMMAISQAATASLANLAAAQMRGADQEVMTLSRDAHQEVAEAAANAASAAGAVMNNGLAAVSRMTDMATRAGNSMGAQAAQAAATGGAQRSRGGARTSRHH
jgi:hypothetical protein